MCLSLICQSGVWLKASKVAEQSCPAAKVVKGFDAVGNITCGTPSSGGGGGTTPPVYCTVPYGFGLCTCSDGSTRICGTY